MSEQHKIILLDERFSKTGEPTVQPVVLWSLRGKACHERLSKEASASPAYEYIRHVQPIPGRTIVLVIGLGSYEFYGLNRNGDGFNEQPYKPGCSNGPGRDAWVADKECIQHHFQTYEKGHVFRHHTNSDPKRAIGKVLKAFWNPFMHRVEILEDIENDKASDLVEQIADGIYPAKSMGCKIKFDVCTQCGNTAPTRKQYCDHLKWQMNYLDPTTGIRYGALNPAPTFFDSSWVFRPADRTGYMLKKVAHTNPYELWSSSELGDLVEDLNNKSAAARKLAVIDKVVRGYPAAVVQSELPEASLIEKYRDTALPTVSEYTKELPYEDLRNLARYPLADTLKSLADSGIILTTPEFLQLFLEKALPGIHLPRGIFDRLSALQAEILELFTEHPSMLSQIMDSFGTTSQHPDAELGSYVSSLREKRSTVSNYLQKRLIPRAWRHDEAPTTDLLEVRDNKQDVYDDVGQLISTGPTYVTTRGAANAAQEAWDETNLKRLVGAGGLMAGAAKLLATPNVRLLSLPVAGAGLFLGQTGLKKPGVYKTTSGEEIPTITELKLQEKEGCILNLLRTFGLEYGINKTGSVILNRAWQSTNATQPMRLFLYKAAHFGLQTPNITLRNYVMGTKRASTDGITEEQLDIEKVAEVIGTLVLAISEN